MEDLLSSANSTLFSDTASLCPHGKLHPKRFYNGKLLPRSIYNVFAKALQEERSMLGRSDHTTTEQGLITPSTLVCNECGDDYCATLVKKIAQMESIASLYNSIESKDYVKSLRVDPGEVAEDDHVYILEKRFATEFRNRVVKVVRKATGIADFDSIDGLLKIPIDELLFDATNDSEAEFRTVNTRITCMYDVVL